MGIARVDIWLANRYRLIAQPISQIGIPSTDVLCVDVSSVFRQCTGWNPALAQQTDEEVQKQMLEHIEFIVGLVKPQKQLFIVVDGVPPMALLQAQRIQRYENSSKHRKFIKSNGCERTDTVFDRNKYTPGTDFMSSFDNSLTFFIRKRISEDPSWQKPIVLYSGPTVHGDSKHKILNFFRGEQESGAVEHGNQTYCIYSTAPDMPILGLMTHEPHLFILRETSSLKIDQEPAQTSTGRRLEDYTGYHLGLLREYWQKDILRESLANLSLESTLEDFVFLCTFLGNDVLPRIATLHVQEHGMEYILSAYQQVVVDCGYLINHDRGGEEINCEALQGLIGILGSRDAELARLKHRMKVNSEKCNKDLVLMDNDAINILQSDDGTYDPLKCWKDWYYHEKMLYEQGSELARREVALSYVHGLVWLAAYYMKGIYCWNYCYSENYGPCLSDIEDLSQIEMDYARVAPLSMNEYIMSVLPLSASHLMPKILQPLVNHPKSSFAWTYKETKRFVRDLEGAWHSDDHHYHLKRFPARRFQKMFRKAPVEKVYPALSSRDKEGMLLVFKYRQGLQDSDFCTSPLPKYFRDVAIANSTIFYMHGPKLEYTETYTGFKPEIPPGREIGDKSPMDFPSLARFAQPLSADVLEVDFDRSGERMAYSSNSFFLFMEGVHRYWPGAAKKLADIFLGRKVLVLWPYLREARVQAIQDPFGQRCVPNYQSQKTHGQLARFTQGEYYWYKGIELNNTDVLFSVELLGEKGRYSTHPAQAVMVMTANGNMHCVLDYLNLDRKSTRMEDDDSSTSQNSPKSLAAPSSLASDPEWAGSSLAREGSKPSDQGDVQNLNLKILGNGGTCHNPVFQNVSGEQMCQSSNTLRETVHLSNTVKTEQMDEPGILDPACGNSMRHEAMGIPLPKQDTAAQIMETVPSDDVTMDGTTGAHSLEESIGSAMDVLNDERGVMDGTEVLEVSDFHRIDEEEVNGGRTLVSAGFPPESLNNKQEKAQATIALPCALCTGLVYATMDGVVHLGLHAQQQGDKQDNAMKPENDEKQNSSNYMDLATVADDLGVSEATLFRILKSCTVTAVAAIGAEEHDLGLNILVQAPNTQLHLSENLVSVLENYQATHTWVFLIVTKCPEAPSFTMEALFPKMKQDRAVRMLTAAAKWIEAQDVSGLDIKEIKVKPGTPQEIGSTSEDTLLPVPCKPEVTVDSAPMSATSPVVEESEDGRDRPCLTTYEGPVGAGELDRMSAASNHSNGESSSIIDNLNDMDISLKKETGVAETPESVDSGKDAGEDN